MTAVRVGTVPSNIYEAYAGPDVGGFGLLPQSSVPRLSPDQNLPSELGLRSIDEPLPFTNTNQEALPKTAAPSKRGAIKVGTLPELAGPGSSHAKYVKPREVLVKEAQDLYQSLTTPGINDERTTAGNIAQSAMTNYSNAVLATPSLAADVLSYPLRRADLLPGGAGANTNVFGVVPKLTVEDIGAGMASLRQGGQTFEEAKRRGAITEAERKARYPVATGTGEVIGDVAAIAGARAPFAPGLRAREVALETAIKSGVPVSTQVLAGPQAFRAAVSQSPGFNTFKKVFGRAGEAGVEGAALQLVKGGDPVEAAAFTAGVDFAAGATSQALLFKYLPIPKLGRVANFAVNAAVMSQIFYAMDVALPGEAKDYEAQKTATQKMLLGYGLGGVLGAFSGRARSGMFSANTPNLTDALASAPRNALQSIMIDYLNSDDTKKMDLKTKLGTMYNNLDKFSDAQLRDLSTAFGASKDRFYTELDKALKGLPPQ